ncbi:MAG: phosphopantetheine-binding protein [Eubacteriales bacterium]|nr:phosphopantetheine-binding protein [Eubacteriales bacterium]
MEFEHLKSFIEQTYHIEAEIKKDSDLTEDLGLDSLELYTILMEIESMYSVEFPQDTLDRVHTVSDVINAIREAMKV